MPAAQYGAASAYAGLAQMAYIPHIPEGRVAVRLTFLSSGILVGAGMLGLLLEVVGMFGCYVILAALVLVFSAITVFSVSEATAHPQKAAHVPALIDAADDDDVDPFGALNARLAYAPPSGDRLMSGSHWSPNHHRDARRGGLRCATRLASRAGLAEGRVRGGVGQSPRLAA